MYTCRLLSALGRLLRGRIQAVAQESDGFSTSQSGKFAQEDFMIPATRKNQTQGAGKYTRNLHSPPRADMKTRTMKPETYIVKFAFVRSEPKVC